MPVGAALHTALSSEQKPHLFTLSVLKIEPDGAESAGSITCPGNGHRASAIRWGSQLYTTHPQCALSRTSLTAPLSHTSISPAIRVLANMMERPTLLLPAGCEQHSSAARPSKYHSINASSLQLLGNVNSEQCISKKCVEIATGKHAVFVKRSRHLQLNLSAMFQGKGKKSIKFHCTCTVCRTGA